MLRRSSSKTKLCLICCVFSLAAVLLLPAETLQAGSSTPIVSRETIFKVGPEGGYVEAEHFYKQSRAEKRAFHITSTESEPNIRPDGDPAHLQAASNSAYVEVLPDTRRSHGDKLVKGENFSNEPGKLAVLHYRVEFTEPGRYYVWVRAFSTGSEDNGLHVGIDGQWPASGQRMQWCKGKRTWRWESRQRTKEQHCGVPYRIFLEVKKPGVHEVQFSMREDGFEFDKWFLTKERLESGPASPSADFSLAAGPAPPEAKTVSARQTASVNRNLEQRREAPVAERSEHGNGSVRVTGELKQWHKVTVELQGPFAHERDSKPNPFVDYRFEVRFRHESGQPTYVVPGYFAADGDSANSSGESGTVWRAHLSPDKPGKWSYETIFQRGENAALDEGGHDAWGPYDGKTGEFVVAPTDKSGRDFRSKGRLAYVGRRYLQFQGSKDYFLKVGADAPETLLAYEDFDGTIARKKNVPLKSWSAHKRDWRAGDPTWHGIKGKGLIGAVNYLAGKGCNAFSFIPYNAGGDGDNVWPMVEYADTLHYDCSKLDQWQIVFDHATNQGMYLHFKLQETENDDLRRGKKQKASKTTALDGGDLGVQRKLYCREMIARFGHELALNWNLGEENTQSTEQQLAMAAYLRKVDPYDHHIVLHTFPEQQDKVYRPLLGRDSPLTGVSLQNSHIRDTHRQTVKWVRASADAGKPWVVAFDESGSAAHGQPPDLGYQGFDGIDRTGKKTYTQHEVRRQTLWGTLMGGGAGVEYYFGYRLAQNDLKCEDWRSRDQSWDDCRRAIEFFHINDLPFWDMQPADELVGNSNHDNHCYCLATPGKIYLVYYPGPERPKLDLASAGRYSVRWYNPREGGGLLRGSVEAVQGGESQALGAPPHEPEEDWAAVIRKL